MSVGIPNIPDREAEWIGLMLQSPISVVEYAPQIPAGAFANKLTAAAWGAMIDLSKAGTQVSVPAVRERIKIDPVELGIPSIPSFLTLCMQKAGADISLDDLASIIVDEAHKRDLWHVLGNLQKELQDGGQSGADIAFKGADALVAAVSANRTADTMSLFEAAKRFTDGVSEAFMRNEPVGHDWGLKELDRIMGTIQPGDFGVLGGPSGQGKSALAMQIGMHISRRLPVLMIQAEMRHEDVAGREVLGMSGVSSADVENGHIRDTALEKLIDASQRLHGIPFDVTYSGDMRISRINSRIQSFKHRHGKCGLVIIDTIKHVDPEDKGAKSLVEKIMSSAKKLDQMAKSNDVPIMALAQVKQGYWERSGTTFYNNDLYGGGDLIEAASWCLLIHQPAIRAERFGGRGSDDVIADWEGKAQVIAGKRRRGKPGRGKLDWIDDRTRFADPDDDVTETFL